MMQLPEGFDVATLVTDFFSMAAPFVGVFFLVGSGFLIIRLLKRV